MRLTSLAAAALLAPAAPAADKRPMTETDLFFLRSTETPPADGGERRFDKYVLGKDVGAYDVP